MQCENSPAPEELFGGQFEPRLWLFLAFQNLFGFFNSFRYFVGSVVEILQRGTDGCSGEDFLLCLC